MLGPAHVEPRGQGNRLFFFDNESFYDRKDFQKIGVQVEIGVPKESTFLEIDFLVTVKSKRGVVTCFTDWKVIERESQKVMQFIAWQKIPKGTFPAVRDLGEKETPLYMSFMDACWNSGEMEVDPSVAPQVVTDHRADGSIHGDLGWHLPARFLYPLIDAVGKLNDFMLNGMMQEALLYGPLTLSQKE